MIMCADNEYRSFPDKLGVCPMKEKGFQPFTKKKWVIRPACMCMRHAKGYPDPRNVVQREL